MVMMIANGANTGGANVTTLLMEVSETILAAKFTKNSLG